MLQSSEHLDPFENANDSSFESLKLTIRNALVEKFSEGNDRPCDEKDFSKTKNYREKLTADIKNWIENMNNTSKNNVSNRSYIENDVLALILVLCGQNNSLQPWNTIVTVENCKTILSNLLKFLNYTSISKLLLSHPKINFTKNVLQIVCSDLTVGNWKCFPASVSCYMWILEFIKQPDLSKHLQLVLPPALLLIDDFVTENQINGALCLNHIVTNLTIAELQFSTGEVIFNGLLPLLRIKEAPVLDAALVALISVTRKLEYNLGGKQEAKWSRFDTIFEILLENMELEQNVDLRNCYMFNLDTLIKSTGSNILRWSKRLLRIFNEYVQTSGKYSIEESFYHSIKAIESYIELSDHIVYLHSHNMFYTLVISLHFCCCDNKMKKGKETVTKCIKIIIESLSEVEKQEIKKNLENTFSKTLTNHKCYEEIRKLLNSY